MSAPHRTSGTAPQEQARWRRRTLGALSGTVLDVGAGSGMSGRFLAPGAEWFALEPAPSARLVRAVEARPHSRLLQSVAEELPLADGDVDAAVCSTALCSVADPDGALAEILRVLRPGGRLVFFEHVAAPAGSGARLLQGLAAPLTRRFDRGCDPRRDTASTIERAGFSRVILRTLRTAGMFGGLAPIIEGEAIR